MQNQSVSPSKANKAFTVQNQLTIKKTQNYNSFDYLNQDMTINKSKDQDEIKLNNEKPSMRHQFKKTKKLWSKQQDSLLISLVQTYGAKEWSLISQSFFNRCGKQCRQRWHNHLRYGITKSQWSNYQKWILFLGVQAYGKKWSLISKILPQRTENTIKNHWNCKMRPLKDSLLNKMQKCFEKNIQKDQNLSQKQKTLLFKIYQKTILCRKDKNKEEAISTIKQIFEDSLKDFMVTKEQINQQSQSMDIQSISDSQQSEIQEDSDQLQEDSEDQQNSNNKKESPLNSIYPYNKNYFDGSPPLQK